VLREVEVPPVLLDRSTGIVSFQKYLPSGEAIQLHSGKLQMLVQAKMFSIFQKIT
jgi:hypothetical protein